MWNPLGEEEQETDHKKILGRLDGLPLAKWHILVAIALGLVWIFDGYEVTLLSLYRHQIEQESGKNTFETLVTAYQLGGIVGSMVFGVLAFMVGRRKIFLVNSEKRRPPSSSTSWE